jgi:glutamate-1-semialdehyde 2,1-aminomutase
MEYLAPVGPVYQAGTLSGNPLAMTAGIKTLDILREKDYSEIELKTVKLGNALREMFQKNKIPVRINQTGSLFTLFFTEAEVVDYESAMQSDVERFGKFFHAMLAEGINLAPAQFEAGFVSFAHSDADIDKTIAACAKAIRVL